MPRALLGVIVVGTVLLGVGGAMNYLRARVPEEKTAGGSAPHAAQIAADANPVNEPEPPFVDRPGSDRQEQRISGDDQATLPRTPIPGVPREVEELKLRYPLLASVIDRSEGELSIQNRDPLWAATMEVKILSEISQKALGLEISNLQVDCRTTICRVQMVFPQRLLLKRFGGPVPRDTVWTGQQPVGFFIEALDLDFRQPVASGLDDSGTPVVVGYVTRPSSTPNQ